MAALALMPCIAHGQLLSYEPFTGMATGSGLVGSGTGATGWSDAGWSGGGNARFQTMAPAPTLTYQISSGAFLDGGNRAVQLSTAPEPVPSGLEASRTFPAQNTTLFFSFLVRAVSIGTGTDVIDLRIGSGATTYASIRIRPDQSGTFFWIGAYKPNGSGGASGAFYTGQTYLVVGQFARTSPTNFELGYWINPPATYPIGSNTTSGTIASNATVSTVGWNISSTDTGGAATTIIVDELRVGYTWTDVVPPAPAPPLVPNVTITPAVKLRWQTQTTKTYQPQYSYDLTNWFNLGPSLSGDGQFKELFDSTDSEAKKFYRIQFQ